jgi:hypothetical protein
MQQLIGTAERQRILEQGLLSGLWSIDQFNKTSPKGEPVLPRAGFLGDHPQFFDKGFRDLQAFDAGHGRRLSW